MINEGKAKLYCCEDISKIENYEQAVADMTQVWHCHHRVEIMPYGTYSKQNLIDNGLYWNVPAAQLIFLTKAEHIRLHALNRSEDTREKLSAALMGRQLSEEHKQKLSEAKRGENNPFFGMRHTEETKRKISDVHMGTHWFNNGEKCIMSFECPQGFMPGRLRKGDQK